MTGRVFDFSRIRISCAGCNLAELCLPRGLEQDELEKLDRIIQRSRALRTGEHLFRAEDPLVSIYAIRSGAIKLYSIMEQANERILGFYLPGEILGLDAIHSERHSGFAVALETSSCCAIPFARLEEICKQIPGLQHQLYKLMSREISHENQLLLTLTNRSAEEKIASFLVNLSGRFRTLGYSATEFRLPMSRKDIGTYLGLSMETVSRVFTRLQREQIIASDRRFVRLTNAEQLHKICSGSDPHSQEQGSAA